MRLLRLPSPALANLILVALLTRSISALVVGTVDTNTLLLRDTCGGQSNLTSCGQGLPSDFCCATGNICLPLNNTGVQTAICCPAGRDCTSINVITCDISFQDASKYPALPLHISDLTKTLPKCGNGCCPIGYECVGNDQCTMKDTTKEAPISTTTTSSSASTFTPLTNTLSASSSTSTSTSSPLAILPSQTADKKKTSSVGLVFAGLIPGLIVGALIVFGVLYFLKKRREKRRSRDDSSSYFGPPTPHPNQPPKISEPIYQPGMSDRTVFTHVRTASGHSIPPEQQSRYDSYYKSNQQRSTGSATLVSPRYNGKSVRTLDPPFETPTRPQRTAQQSHVRGLFSKSPSVRTTNSRMSRKTLGKSTSSMETISMLMGEPRVPSYQQTPNMRQTTYSDVYRAAGISPSRVPVTARPSLDTQR